MHHRPALPCPRRTGRLLLVITFAVALVAGGLTWASPAAAAVGVPVTYEGHSYSSSVSRPSENKPQSKLWYLDGSWWSLMVEANGSLVYIHKLVDHTWQNTGVLVDSRVNSTGDALWSSKDNRLYVASRAGGSNLRVNAFTYSGGSWTKVPNFPVEVDSGGGSESATIDQDSLGRLWVTYTRAARLWVAHSTTSVATWTAGFQPPGVDTVLKSDDISALIAFGSSIGVLYSDQESGVFRFAIHDDADGDDVWRTETVPLGPGLADDHINLKQLVGDSSGRIFAAIKTSADEVSTDPNATLVGVLVRSSTGSWSLAEAGTLADNHTRPIIMVDSTNKDLYFFATHSGDIVYKKAPLSDVVFPAGRGDPFVDSAASLNNAAGAKDPATAASGLVILATADGVKRYAHAEMELAGGPTDPVDRTPPTATTNPGSGATGVAVSTDVTATFSEAVQGVNGSTFTLTTGGSPVPATVSYNSTTLVATLDPGSNLAAGTTYTATLTDGITDLATNPLSPISWSFTTATATASTGDGTPPTVKARTPKPGATGVGLAVNATASFNEAVQGVDSSSFTLTNDSTGSTVPANVYLSSTTNKWVLDPSVKLAADTWHTVRLTDAIRDASGTPLVPVSWTFLTGPAPTVKGRSPAANATGVSPTANVLVTFSEAVDNVTTSTIVLRNAATGAAVSGAVTRDGTTNRWILDPGVTLAANTTYTVTVVGGTSGVRDVVGNVLKKSVAWSFTTGA